MGLLLRSITRTCRFTNWVFTLIVVSSSISVGGVGVGFGFKRGGGGASPSLGRPSFVTGDGTGVAVGLGTADAFRFGDWPVWVGVVAGLACMAWLVRRGLPSCGCAAPMRVVTSNPPQTAVKIAIVNTE